MMDTGFFKWLWRFNAIAIALLALTAVAGVIIALGSELLRTFSHDSPDDGFSIVEPDATDAAVARPNTYRLGNIETLPGHQILRISQWTDEGRGEGYGSFSKYDSGNMVNVGYIDPTTLATRWIFAPESTLVASFTDVLRSVSDQAKLRATLFVAVTQDTNGDKRLDSNDRMDLMMSDAEGGNLHVVQEDVRGLLQTVEISPTVETILYLDKDGTRIARLDLDTGQFVGASQPVPVSLASTP